MEEFNYSNFQKAPYLELDDYKAPKGISSYFIKMDDGIRLRVCHWICEEKNKKETIPTRSENLKNSNPWIFNDKN